MMARLDLSPHRTRTRERELADLIEELELAHDCSRSHHIRAVINAAAKYLWQLRCELCEQGLTAQGEQQ
jgi:hypothetical protein